MSRRSNEIVSLVEIVFSQLWNCPCVVAGLPDNESHKCSCSHAQAVPLFLLRVPAGNWRTERNKNLNLVSGSSLWQSATSDAIWVRWLRSKCQSHQTFCLTKLMHTRNKIHEIRYNLWTDGYTFKFGDKLRTCMIKRSTVTQHIGSRLHCKFYL